MISKTLINSAKEIAYEDSEKNGVPSKFQIDFAVEKAQFLANKLGANEDVCILGAYLMDCKLGTAYIAGNLGKHVSLSKDEAEMLLSKDKDITDTEKNNVIQCVLQHHGSSGFYSKEAEIVCNADCYKFISIKGVIGSIKGMRDMPLDAIIKLFIEKADEKWQALSLDYCKKALKIEYTNIKLFLESYKN